MIDINVLDATFKEFKNSAGGLGQAHSAAEQKERELKEAQADYETAKTGVKGSYAAYQAATRKLAQIFADEVKTFPPAPVDTGPQVQVPQPEQQLPGPQPGGPQAVPQAE